jgi:type II secretory pathway pseudopilin PulG
MKFLQNSRFRKQSGMAHKEVLIVILVLLNAVVILFSLTVKWRKDSDRSANILNIRNCQQAMRGCQGCNCLNAGDPFPSTSKKRGLLDYLAPPVLPSAIGKAYQFTEKVTPSAKVPYDNSLDHLYVCGPSSALPVVGGKNATYSFAEPKDTEGW